ncbi:MAG: hypothetical protein GXY13_10395, partial [Acidimicrobiales bacterium]|nr:hypothetical protein [Acidimicrobiales bacterium]
MPRTLTFPAPSSTVCPICSAPLSGARCDACGARFDGPDGTTLWRVDHDLHDLSVVRNEVVARLLTEAAWTERAVAAPAPTAPAAPAGPPVAPVGPAVVPERRRPSLTVAELLVGAGAVSLVAAVVVFAAVKWS